MTPFASFKIIEGYKERLYDQRDTATLAAYQGEYLARVKQMPPIDELLIDRKSKHREIEQQTTAETVMTIRAWLHNSGRKIKKVPKGTLN